ncbi:MAG: serine hydrolase [Candidatus Methanoperedens sp.]|nr:serine hydrolase [Candidatus Methanoperedens sp.]
MKKLINIFCLAIILFSNSFAQNRNVQLDSLFSYYNENGMFNGIVLAAENGKVVYKKAFGFSDFENKIPLDTSSVFSIGSVTKPFTAVAIMMLKEKGLLSYEDKLKDYFPTFPDYAKKITIRHLLTHTSGLVDFINDLKLLDKVPDLTDKIGLDSLINQPALKFETGKEYSYCNSGYFLLGLIIEKVTGKTYREFFEENILRLLGMKHTYILDETMTNIPNRISSYKFFWEKSDDDLHLKANGNGNMYSTVDDLLLFDQALYDDKLLRQETLREAYDTTGLPHGRSFVYGFGWKIQADSTGNIVSHNGAIAGFRAHLWRDLRNKNTLIILANNTWLSDDPDILSATNNIMQGKSYKLGKIMVSEFFMENWYFRGFDAAMQKMRVIIGNDSSRYDFSPDCLNDLGYYFMGRNQVSEAIKLFELAVELHPKNDNLWDSLGEAYMKAGNRAQAIKNYKKALELNPDLETAKSALQKLEKE